MAEFISRFFDLSEHSPFPYTIKEKSLYDNLTFSMVVQACLRGVMKQSGSGPPSLQIFDSISIRTESPKPRGLVAWSEKYLDGNKITQLLGGAGGQHRCSKSKMEFLEKSLTVTEPLLQLLPSISKFGCILCCTVKKTFNGSLTTDIGYCKNINYCYLTAGIC